MYSLKDQGGLAGLALSAFNRFLLGSWTNREVGPGRDLNAQVHFKSRGSPIGDFSRVLNKLRIIYLVKAK